MNKRRFRPDIVPTIVTVLMLIVLLSLGTWQVHRSVEKRALIDSYEQAPSQPPVSMVELGEDWEKYRFRRISLKGQYDRDHQILLENQPHNRQPGFMVITPFRLSGSQQVVLVNRGWLERDPRATSLPNITLVDGVEMVTGLVSHPPGVGIRMGSLDQSPIGWPKPVPYIDEEWIGLQVGAKVLPWMVLLHADQPAGFTREWKPGIAVRMPPEKHQGYALQWYSLAIALIFLFVVGSLRPEGKVREDDEQ